MWFVLYALAGSASSAPSLNARPRHEHSLGSRVGGRPEAPAPRRPHRKSRRSDHAASQRGHRSARCPPPAGTGRVQPVATHQCSASPWHRAPREAVAALPVSRATGQQLGCLQWRLDPPRPASTHLSSRLSSQDWRPLERSSEWSLLSRPDLPGCLGRLHGRHRPPTYCMRACPARRRCRPPRSHPPARGWAPARRGCGLVRVRVRVRVS